jgi:hypothetical protein
VQVRLLTAPQAGPDQQCDQRGIDAVERGQIQIGDEGFQLPLFLQFLQCFQFRLLGWRKGSVVLRF